MVARLIPHPSSLRVAVTVIEVLHERRGDWLWLRFVVEGNPNTLAWPPESSGRADGLWKTTCFEAFVATGSGYVEFNLSPSGQWASYAFDDYRAAMRPAEVTASVLGLDAGEDYVALEAEIELPPGARRLGLSAVIETTDGAISYWALAHPSDKPDFHHPDSFVLELP